MKCQRELFSLRADEHYLNCAYKAPLLKSAEAACIQALIRERNPMDITEETYFEEVSMVKEYFSKLVNAKTSQIAIVPSVSYGFSSILNNTGAKEDGNAITVKDEFPSGYFALESWCKRNDNELFIAKPDTYGSVGESWNKNLLDSINERTSVVLISSVHYMNGMKFDLEEIGKKCRTVGAKFLVDGTQSVGALKMDIEEYRIDALVCAGYKWLLGPYSIALTYFSEYYNNGVPLEEAWLNRKNSNIFNKLSDYEMEYRPDAARYNVGETSNFILMPMIRESLKQIVAWKPDSIQQYCAELIQPLISYMKNLNIEFENKEYFCNHLFALRLPQGTDLEVLYENLIKNNICLSVRGEHLRISVNVFNDQTDIDKLIETIDISLNT